MRTHLLRGAHLFVAYVCDARIGIAKTTKPIESNAVLLDAFFEWMHKQRGTGKATLYNYSISIRDLLNRIGEDPYKLDAACLRRLVLERSQQCGWAATKKCTTALRMFLRFLIAEGKRPARLDGAIPIVAHWRLFSLPRYLPADEVEHVIASCDLTSLVGKRDRAILLLLSRLAFRASDIVQLRLGDIAWKDTWISVSGKSRRET